MEKAQHNLRVEMENTKNTLALINQNLEDQTSEELVIELNDQPVIVDILSRLDALNDLLSTVPEVPTENTMENFLGSEDNVIVSETVETAENVQVNYPVYDPNVIEPYSYEVASTTPPQPPAPQLVTQPVATLPPPEPVQTVTPVSTTQTDNPKTPRKRGKKVTIN
jgi:hypothetical protein